MSDLPLSVARYRIQSRLSSDPLGDMYHGFDPLIERPVIVRVFNLRLVDPQRQPAIKEKFYAEMQRTGVLGHHGIAALFDAGELPGGLFIATEFVEGTSLADVFARGVQGDLAQRAALLIQMSDALDYAHQSNAPHLSLEPVHVRIDARQMLKIGGFGAASILDSIADEAGLPRLLSSQYSAPERARREVCDTRADVYSLARIALHILRGEHDEPVAHPGHPPAMPEYLAEQGVQSARWTAVFAKALAASPADRFATPVAFTLELFEVLAAGDEKRLLWVRSGTTEDMAMADVVDGPEPGQDADAFVTMLGNFKAPATPALPPGASDDTAETMMGGPDAPTVMAHEHTRPPGSSDTKKKPNHD